MRSTTRRDHRNCQGMVEWITRCSRPRSKQHSKFSVEPVCTGCSVISSGYLNAHIERLTFESSSTQAYVIAYFACCDKSVYNYHVKTHPSMYDHSAYALKPRRRPKRTWCRRFLDWQIIINHSIKCYQCVASLTPNFCITASLIMHVYWTKICLCHIKNKN
jgi:hypothetical protein